MSPDTERRISNLIILACLVIICLYQFGMICYEQGEANGYRRGLDACEEHVEESDAPAN